MPVIPLSMTVFFVAIVAVLAGLFILVAWRAGQNLGEEPSVTWLWTLGTAGFVLVWLAATAILAAHGKLSDWSTWPPPMMKLVATAGILTLFYAFSRIGGRLAFGLSIAGLVGFQVFRVAVELVLFLLHRSGVVPIQMTLEGLNFDILTGLSAPVVAWLATRDRLPTWGLWVWNVIGLSLLLNIVTISILSTPVPFRIFLNEPANTFITQAPYVWLPVFLVQAAFFGHLLVFRRLRRSGSYR